MSCAETQILVHPLLDGELDVCHARDVETHVADCPLCTAQLRQYGALHHALSAPDLRFTAPLSLRRDIEAALPSRRTAPTPSRRLVLGGVPWDRWPPLRPQRALCSPSLDPTRIKGCLAR